APTGRSARPRSRAKRTAAWTSSMLPARARKRGSARTERPQLRHGRPARISAALTSGSPPAGTPRIRSQPCPPLPAVRDRLAEELAARDDREGVDVLADLPGLRVTE